MKYYQIVRQQLTPPGEDAVVRTVRCEDPQDILVQLAEEETASRTDVDHIAVNPNSVALVGQPKGTGNTYSQYSSLVRFISREVVDWIQEHDRRLREEVLAWADSLTPERRSVIRGDVVVHAIHAHLIVKDDGGNLLAMTPFIEDPQNLPGFAASLVQRLRAHGVEARLGETTIA